MHTLRRIKATILHDDTDPDSISMKLELGGVPITDADCRSCPDPCDEGHEPYPSRFDVDMETQMLGTVKPYHRQIVISTGKIDWDREVTEMKGSLAYHIENNVDRHKPLPDSTSPNDTNDPNGSPSNHKHKVSGVFDSTDSSISRIGILNGSHRTLSDEHEADTVLVFPDYRVVCGVPRTKEGAQSLWDGWLDPRLGPTPVKQENLSSWVIPYSCVVLLCSHKRRDNRCSIAAAKLLTAFTHSLESQGYHVDTELEHPDDKPLEEAENQKEAVEKHLREYATSKKALVLRNSHTGGHKFAGNCIVSLASL
ncbi:hypothetical protein PQX77_008058 [Marasmius sp. AFHP31]|nr:hypothetical protein PQX77_008058 [Marasmius sp. AFHP31]